MAKIPKFKSEKEEAAFWATHDLTDFLEDLEELKEPVELAPKLKERFKKRAQKKLLTIRLEPQQIEDAKKIAEKLSIPYQTLMRSWIHAGIKKEKAALDQSQIEESL